MHVSSPMPAAAILVRKEAAEQAERPRKLTAIPASGKGMVGGGIIDGGEHEGMWGTCIHI